MSLRPSRSSLLALALVPAGLVGIASGCELIVPGTLSNVRCSEEGAIGPPVCPLGTFCQAGVCRDGPPSLGEPCGDEVACGPADECLDPARLGLRGDPFCSRTCCSSADCGAGTGLVCGALGPGKMCVPADMWGRDRPGSRFAGEPCGEGTDCRSGACTDGGGTCTDTCCSDVECGAFGAVCREGGQGWTCAPPLTEPKLPFSFCQHDAECASGVCATWADGLSRCVEPCCSSTECGKVKLVDGLKNVLCVPISHGTAIVYACAAFSEGDANRGIGAPCEEPGDCRGGLCVEAPAGSSERAAGTTGKVCSDVCCTDASCGAPHLFACVPAADEAFPEAPPGTGGQGFDLQCRRR